MSVAIPDNVIRRPAEEADEFPFGWRFLPITLPDGKVTYTEVPLRQEDFLDPQLGDQMVQDTIHSRCSIDLFTKLDARYDADPETGVFYDLKMKWGIFGLKEPAPDITVVRGIKNKHATRDSFNVVREGARPCLVIEVVSPLYPGDEDVKPAIYERARINEYIIVNPHAGEANPYYTLEAYRLVKGIYQPVQADAQGRILSETTNMQFGVENEKLVLTDVATGKPLRTHRETEAARLAEQQQAEQEQQRVEHAEQRAKHAEQHAEAERQRVKRLRAYLRTLGIDPDGIEMTNDQ